MEEKLNKQNKNGSWTLTGDYLTYRRDGGALNPSAWNQALKDAWRDEKRLRKQGFRIPLPN